MPDPVIEAVLVVVPARNEEALLPAGLAALAAAAEQLQHDRGVPTCLVVVADRCSDRTVELASDAGAQVVVVDKGCVGAARRRGVEEGVRHLPTLPSDRVWLASTDADSRVPRTWLSEQLELATRGAALVTGRAVPDPDGMDVDVRKRWHELHLSPAELPVHGANLGVRLDVYEAVGGWPPLREHEDRSLVEALLRIGTPRATGPDVTTSARLVGRAPGGFSGYLRGLTASPVV